MYGHEDWQKGSWEWYRFAAALPSIAIPILGESGSGLAYTGRCILTGWSVFNTTSTAGNLAIRNGQDANGQIVAQLAIPASGNAPMPPGQAGIIIDVGIFTVLTTAVVTGALYVTPLFHLPKTPPGR